jgi:anaerobic selenocysteine-containing dehydrogenase
LGADSLLLNAMSRAILEDDSNGVLRWLRARQNTPDLDWDNRKYGDLWRLANQRDIDRIGNKKSFDKRRRSRVTNLNGFLDFLGFHDPAEETFQLKEAAKTAGVDEEKLREVIKAISVKRSFLEPTGEKVNRRPRVAILYEKGIIWGFNYNNIAAVGSLGVVLGAYSEQGKLVGRVGGHQKGWATSKANLSDVFESSTWDCANETEKAVDYTEGYPFRNATDSFSDDSICEVYGESKFVGKQLAKDFFSAGEIQLQHNLDLHVFGFPENECECKFKRNGKDFVQLKNGVRTLAKPDVNLLWIIGGNYFGQTNDAEAKRKKLEKRLLVKGKTGKRLLPATTDKRAIIDAFKERIEADGLVVVHQELFTNPTTNYADIIIPAVGWGEDNFIRYNAQRRLKLYARFQDPPLHPDDEKRLEKLEGDPVSRMHLPRTWRHSPKPDWRIFRDVATGIGKYFDGKSSTKSEFFENKLARNKPTEYWKDNVATPGYFYWDSSSEVADDMAIWSHRGLAAADSCGTSMLGDLYLYGLSQGIWPTEKDNDGVMHRLLGLDENNNSLDDALLSHELGGPGYTIPSESKVHQNRIASNGVLLPVYGVDASGKCVTTAVTKDKLLDTELIEQRISEIERVVGSLRVDRAFLNYMRAHKSDAKVQLGAPFFFVKSNWEDNQQAFNRINKRADDELLVTNGRFNHLWNNMFHHIRNEYVNKRWPNDLPGTIMEVNPDWAKNWPPNKGKIENGQVVKLTNGSSTCVAVVSLQDWVPIGQAFLMFSYPVKDRGVWNFNGYANNISDGYVDGIHPIAALKYSKAKVEVLDRSVELPTYAQRNQIAEAQDSLDREDWQMRELIVQKGITRAERHSRQRPTSPETKFTNVDEFANELKTNSTTRQNFAAGIGSFMTWDSPSAGRIDEWHGSELGFAQAWARGVFDTDPEKAFIELLKKLAPRASGALAHNSLSNDAGKSLQDLFLTLDEAETPEQISKSAKPIMELLLNSNRTGTDRSLVVPEKPSSSELYKLVTTGGMKSFFEGETEIVKQWIENLTPKETDRMAVQPSFKNHIVQMFRQEDIDGMNNAGGRSFDLTDKAAVEAKADEIIDRISRDARDGGLMPPAANGGPWPQEWIDLFIRWKEEGFAD